MPLLRSNWLFLSNILAIFVNHLKATRKFSSKIEIILGITFNWAQAQMLKWLSAFLVKTLFFSPPRKKRHSYSHSGSLFGVRMG
jgi:hypothetical protein